MPGVWGGIQRGSGAKATVPEWAQMSGGEHVFRLQTQAQHPLKGPEFQKDAKGKFFYIVWRGDDPQCNRRAKLYVETITPELLAEARSLKLVIAGRAKDGYPCCATIKPLEDWHVG